MSTTTDQTTRQRTPPEIKWLANELAATRGQMEQLDRDISAMKARRKRLKATYEAMAQVAAQWNAARLPELVPTVTPHSDRYGGRGQLRAFLRETVKAAYPNAIDSLTLMEMTIRRFGLALSAPKLRTRYYDNTLRRQLLALADAGCMERVLVNGPVRTGWRWKADAPSLEQLKTEQG